MGDQTKTGRSIVHQETICCGFKRCPTVTEWSDGSIDIDDNDGGGRTQHVAFNPDQAAALRTLLGKKS